MSYALTMDWILHLAPGVPAPAKKSFEKIVAKKCCHLLSLQKEGTQSVLLFVCSPCTAALSAPRGRMGDKISQSYLQVVRCLNFRHHLSLVSQRDLTLPSNLTRSTLCGTRDRLVHNMLQKLEAKYYCQLRDLSTKVQFCI